MDFAAIVAWLTTHWADLAEGTLMFLGAASVIARLTPTDADDKIIASILKVVHGFGLTKPAAPAEPTE
jgi:hypothetical protein